MYFVGEILKVLQVVTIVASTIGIATEKLRNIDNNIIIIVFVLKETS